MWHLRLATRILVWMGLERMEKSSNSTKKRTAGSATAVKSMRPAVRGGHSCSLDCRTLTVAQTAIILRKIPPAKSGCARKWNHRVRRNCSGTGCAANGRLANQRIADPAKERDRSRRNCSSARAPFTSDLAPRDHSSGLAPAIAPLRPRSCPCARRSPPPDRGRSCPG